MISVWPDCVACLACQHDCRQGKSRPKHAPSTVSPKGNKKTLNVGKSLSAGLDDYVYENAAVPDDDYDFM
jgi:hypothetical protein